MDRLNCCWCKKRRLNHRITKAGVAVEVGPGQDWQSAKTTRRLSAKEQGEWSIKITLSFLISDSICVFVHVMKYTSQKKPLKFRFELHILFVYKATICWPINSAPVSFSEDMSNTSLPFSDIHSSIKKNTLYIYTVGVIRIVRRKRTWLRIVVD